MKELRLKNFRIGKGGDIHDRPIMMACRNYESKREEEWTIACLAEEEAKQVYEELKAYFG